MVAKPKAGPPTLADLDALPPGIKGEIIEGVLYTMTRPRMKHQDLSSSIAADTKIPFQRGRGGPGGWWIVSEPGIELPNTPEISPDVAGWRKERMPEQPTDAIKIVPDWVCEVLSPTTRRHNHKIKVPYYAKIGVKHLWIADVDNRELTAYRLTESGHWLMLDTYSDETEARIEPFQDVALDLTLWWPAPPPAPEPTSPG